MNFKPMLAEKYDPEKHVIKNWILSEKYDGVRCIFYRGVFYSRNNLTFNVPKEFTNELLKNKVIANNIIDGELWTSRASFDKVSGIVRRNDATIEDYKDVKFMIFDIPSIKDTYINRIKYLNENLTDNRYYEVVKTYTVKNKDDIMKHLDRILKLDGEGAIIRYPDSYYENKRSKFMLKVITSINDEGTLIGYENGKKGTKYEKIVGKLVLSWVNPNGDTVQFCVGSGLTDEQRNNPPSLNSLITFKYKNLTKNGVPRQPIFIGVRDYE